MVNKTFIPEGEAVPASQIGATLEALAATIAARRDADEASYTYRLLTGNVDDVLKKVMEESGEVALAAKDVEGWATSSLAAAVALEAASAGAGDAVSDAEAADEGAGAPLSVQLPPEYGEAVDHLRYEAADVVYHLLVVLERYGITLDEFAAELNNRMTEGEQLRGPFACTTSSCAAESSVQLQVLCGEETEISRQPERAKRYEELRGSPRVEGRRISWPDCLELMACAASQMWS